MSIPLPNYTQVPNIIMDQYLTILTGLELKILLIICRKTLGWHKLSDRISLSQLEKLTASSRSQIIESIKTLLEKNLIKKDIVGEKGSQQVWYELNFQEFSTSTETKLPQSKNPTPPSSKIEPTKETLTKENTTKEKQLHSPTPQKPKGPASAICGGVSTHEEKNKETVNTMKQEIPDKTAGLYIYFKGKVACDPKNGVELSLKMPPDDFERLLMKAYHLEFDHGEI